MPKPPPRQDDRVRHAAELALRVAPWLDLVLFTHYPDVETLDTLRPGETDLQAVQAATRAAAAELVLVDIEVLVQRADRAAFRRWMDGRDDTPANRLAWIDRGRLLRGPAALALLGVAPSPVPPRKRFGRAPGPLADRLIELFDDEQIGDGEFDWLVQELMAEGRTDVLDLAIRKLREQEGDEDADNDEAGEAGDQLNWVLLVAAEGAAVGPSGWAELVALPVALSAGDVPDGEALGAGLIASGALAESEEIRFLPGWRSPDALAALSFGAVRRVLTALVEGKPPRDLPPGDTDDLARGGFGVLLGLRIDWGIPVWEEILAAGGLPKEPDEDAEPTPEEADRAARFDRWRGSVFQASQGCVPLALVAFSQVANEIDDFLADAGEQTGGLDDIRAFVADGRQKAGDEEVVCRADIIGDDLALTLYTVGGQAVDSLIMPADRLPARAEEMPPLIGAFVRVVQDAP